MLRIGFEPVVFEPRRAGGSVLGLGEPEAHVAGPALSEHVLDLEPTEFACGEVDAFCIECEWVALGPRFLGLTTLSWRGGTRSGCVLSPQCKLTWAREPGCVKDNHLRMISNGRGAVVTNSRASTSQDCVHIKIDKKSLRVEA